MTTTPSPELPDLDRLEALARAATPGDWLMHETYACNGELSGYRIVAEDGYELIGEDTAPGTKDAEFIAAANPAAVLALIALARLAQPEGEAPQAVISLEVVAAQLYLALNDSYQAGIFVGEDEKTVCTALADYNRYRSTRAPAAQHAESGAQAKPMFDVETRDELTDEQNLLLDHRQTLQELLICFMSWEPQVCVLGNVRADKAAAAIRAALAAQSQGAQAALREAADYCDQQRAGTSNYAGQCADVIRQKLMPKYAAQQAAAPGALPERDPSKPAEQQGMFRKFDVRRTDGSDQPGGKHHGCRYYVLDLTHDQHAPAAMRAYAAACAVTHPLLAADIMAEFGAAPSAPGTPEAPAGQDAKDAARYQWLRERWVAWTETAEERHPSVYRKREKLDEWIDRAAQLDGGQGEGS